MRKVILFFLLVFLLPLFTYAQPSDRYEYVTISNGTLFYFDRQTAHYINSSIVDYWEKAVFSDEARKDYLEGLKRAGGDISRLTNLRYTMTHMQIDTISPRQRIGEIAYYNENGDLLYNTFDPMSMWISIVPDTVGEQIHNSVKTYVGKAKPSR